jgi:YD repeat-containing protein
MNKTIIFATFAAACSTDRAPDSTDTEQAVTPAPSHPCSAQLGSKPWHGEIGGFDPCTGNLIQEVHAGPITLIYNSLDAGTLGPAGYGMRLDIRDRVTIGGDGSVTRTLPDGEQIKFAPDGLGGFASPPETNVRLSHPSAGQYVIRAPGGDRFFYTRPNGAAWLLTSMQDHIGNTTTITVDASDRETAITDAVGNTTSFGWSANRLASVTDAEGLVWTLGYDAGNQLVSVAGAGTGESLVYDAGAKHFLVSRRTATNTPIGSYEYNADGSAAAWTDADNRRTIVTSFPLEVSVTDAFHNTETYDFTLAGELARTVEASGLATATHTYDALHRITQTTDWLGAATRYAYNASHDVTSVTDRYGRVTAYTYDADHDVLTVRDATGLMTTYSYDANDLVLTDTDPSGRVTTYHRAPDGNLLSITGSDGTTVASYTYGGHGELLTARDANGRTTTYSYDAYLNLASETSPDGVITTYQSSRLGRLLASTTAAAEQRSWLYDAANRLTRVVYENGGDAQLVLDADSRATSSTQRGGPTTLSWSTSYAADGRVATTSSNGVLDQSSAAGMSSPPPPPPPACTPLTCASYPNGGTFSDGCGGTITCSGSGSGSAAGM